MPSSARGIRTHFVGAIHESPVDFDGILRVDEGIDPYELMSADRRAWKPATTRFLRYCHIVGNDLCVVPRKVIEICGRFVKRPYTSRKGIAL